MSYNKHCFTFLASGPEERLLHVNSTDRRVCCMYYNKNSFIAVSHGIFLRLGILMYPLNRDLHGWGYVKNLSELRKEGVRKEKSSISSFIVRGYPQVPAGWALWARHRSHVDNPREWDMYQYRVGKLAVTSFIC